MIKDISGILESLPLWVYWFFSLGVFIWGVFKICDYLKAFIFGLDDIKRTINRQVSSIKSEIEPELRKLRDSIDYMVGKPDLLDAIKASKYIKYFSEKYDSEQEPNLKD